MKDTTAAISQPRRVDPLAAPRHAPSKKGAPFRWRRYKPLTPGNPGTSGIRGPSEESRRSSPPEQTRISGLEPSSRYQSLDMWRGLACMMLVVYHSTFYVTQSLRPGGLSIGLLPQAAVRAASFFWFGVPIFFVVSGYCIAASVNSLQRRPYSMTTFFTRRLRRIYPPFWAGCAWAVAVTFLIATAMPGLYERCRQLPRMANFSGWNWAGNLCAAESWLHHLTGAGSAFLMRNTWTLCLEEQFYLLCGLLLAVSARRFFLGALVITAGALVWRHGGRMLGLDLGGTFLEGHWLTFAAGILVYYQLNRATSGGSRKLCTAVFVAGAAYAAMDRLWGASTDEVRHIDGYIFVACVFAAFLGWLRRFDTTLVNAALARPLLWCGKRSYSIYLTHYPVVVALACGLHFAGLNTSVWWLTVVLPLCLTVAVTGGNIFHLLVERHFLNAPMSERKGGVQPQPA